MELPGTQGTPKSFSLPLWLLNGTTVGLSVSRRNQAQKELLTALLQDVCPSKSWSL